MLMMVKKKREGRSNETTFGPLLLPFPADSLPRSPLVRRLADKRDAGRQAGRQQAKKERAADEAHVSMGRGVRKKRTAGRATAGVC